MPDITRRDFRWEKVKPYEFVDHVYAEHIGYIAWRLGTGDNIELLHIRTFEKGRGFGRVLFYRMLDELQSEPPYHSIFGFTRVGNEDASAFYGELGFDLQEINGVYKDGGAILFQQEFHTLVAEREKYESITR